MLMNYVFSYKTCSKKHSNVDFIQLTYLYKVKCKRVTNMKLV